MRGSRQGPSTSATVAGCLEIISGPTSPAGPEPGESFLTSVRLPSVVMRCFHRSCGRRRSVRTLGREACAGTTA
jgi:hypothetical protein